MDGLHESVDAWWVAKEVTGRLQVQSEGDHEGQYISNKENGHNVGVARRAQFIVPWGDTSAPQVGAIHCAPTSIP
jgi:hypothetical protein